MAIALLVFWSGLNSILVGNILPLEFISAYHPVGWDGIHENNEANRRLNNAVDFRIRVTEEKGKIRLSWQLVYKGPRPPLVMLPPSLDRATDMTEVHVFARGKSGSVHALEFMPRLCLHPDPPKRAQFVTAGKGQPIKGEFALPVQALKNWFQHQWPKEFDSTSSLLAVKLVHTPVERGETWNLDAWTGTLLSNIAEFRHK